MVFVPILIVEAPKLTARRRLKVADFNWLNHPEIDLGRNVRDSLVANFHFVTIFSVTILKEIVAILENVTN